MKTPSTDRTLPPPSRRSISPAMYSRPPSSARVSRTGYSAIERPMSSHKGAGYTSTRKTTSDSVSQESIPESQKSEDEEREEKLRSIEVEIHRLITSSAKLASHKQLSQCLREAKEASTLLQSLNDILGREDVRFAELSSSVYLCLAFACELNGLYNDAIEVYTVLLGEKSSGDGNRFRVNLGNLHFRKEEYPAALKMYRMVLDGVPESEKYLRTQIMKNIAITQLKMGRLRQAVEQYEISLEDRLLDPQTARNLFIGYAKTGDLESMKKAFCKLLADLPNYEAMQDQEEISSSKTEGLNCIISCARITAQKVQEAETSDGYDWCITQLKQQGLHSIVHELLVEKADSLVRSLRFTEAVSLYKEIIEMDKTLSSALSLRLASVSLMQDEIEKGQDYSDQCTAVSRYNHESWVTRGIAAYKAQALTQARAHFQEALRLEPETIEALYNLGLVFKAMATENEEEELQVDLLESSYSLFLRVHRSIPENPETLYQLGHLCELRQSFKESIQWFEALHGLVPEDAGVLAKLAALHFALEDEARALNYYQESYSIFPCNMDVLCWLAAFYSKNEMFEKAVEYFEMAAQLQPAEVKWKLMVASCFRRSGDYSKALELYMNIHRAHPQNQECLKFIVQLCGELGQERQKHDFEEKLCQLEKAEVLTQLQKPNSTKYQTKTSTYIAETPSEISSINLHSEERRPVESALDDWGHGPLGEELLPI